MSALFNMDHIESCMGGNYKGLLFDLTKYRQRMEIEDSTVANSIRMLAIRNNSSSHSSDLSDVSAHTQYVRTPSPMMLG